jgi:hypothetical protein
MRNLYAVFLLVACVTVSPAFGHHSDAGYDREMIVVLEAKVSRYVFRNPHVAIIVEAEDESGKTTEWVIETGSTPIMRRSGWTETLIHPGDRVNIRAHPERSGKRRAILNTLETSDGKLWSQVEKDTEANVSTSTLSGVWDGIASTNLRKQFPNAVLTPSAAAALRSYDPHTEDPGIRCIADPPPFLISSSNYLTGIEILEDRVILRNEMFDSIRTVYMDGRDHPENGERSNEGHSIGLWEDDVLVVDTALFTDNRVGNGEGVPSGSQKHLVERYSLSEDGTRAIVDVFLKDPEFLAEPFIGRTEMVFVPHLQLYRYNCILE